MDFRQSDYLTLAKNSGVKTAVPFYGALRMQRRLLGEHLLLLKFMSPHLFLAAYLWELKRNVAYPSKMGHEIQGTPPVAGLNTLIHPLIHP